ncbi:MAG TPA: cupredoxin domain-containing protein [Gaiellaceae bacterium]|jgi:uncharacterized cupredoxin-like copper-binding protein
MKRTLILFAASAVAGATLFALAPFAGARPAAQTATSVSVTAKEYRFILSRKSAPHGVVAFHVVNKGKLKHDFKIAGHKTPLIKPGGRATLKVTLARGKSYRYICTVPGHVTLGMKGTFRST